MTKAKETNCRVHYPDLWDRIFYALSHLFFFFKKKVLSRALQKHPRDLPGVRRWRPRRAGRIHPTPPYPIFSATRLLLCLFPSPLKNTGRLHLHRSPRFSYANGKCLGVFLRSILSLVGEFGKGRWTFEANGAGEGGGQFSPSLPPSAVNLLFGLSSLMVERDPVSPVGAQSHPPSESGWAVAFP